VTVAVVGLAVAALTSLLVVWTRCESCAVWQCSHVWCVDRWWSWWAADATFTEQSTWRSLHSWCWHVNVASRLTVYVFSRSALN